MRASSAYRVGERRGCFFGPDVESVFVDRPVADLLESGVVVRHFGWRSSWHRNDVNVCVDTNLSYLIAVCECLGKEKVVLVCKPLFLFSVSSRGL